jgi:hypothetical protein
MLLSLLFQVSTLYCLILAFLWCQAVAALADLSLLDTSREMKMTKRVL